MEKAENELQLFDFTAKQLSLERRVFSRSRIHRYFENLSKKFNFDEETLALLFEQIPAICDNLMNAFNEELAALDELDTKYFTVPNYVLLAEDSDLVKQYTEEDKSRLDREFAAMTQLFLENSCMIESLRMENAEYDSIEGLVQEELKVHEQVRQTFNKEEFDKLQNIYKDLKSKPL